MTLPAIARNLKDTPEQRKVVGPLVGHLVNTGWRLDQIVYGRTEWRVPKTPSEATRREKGHTFAGFPVDIAVFDSPETTGDPRHVLFLIECKPPDELAGVTQLEAYFVGEPHARLGVWVNNPEPSARAVFLYRTPDGRLLLKKHTVSDLPLPNEPIHPGAKRLHFRDLVTPPAHILKRTMEDLLDKTVASDSNVTRREEQLDQLCNLLLLKLDSDKKAKAQPTTSPFFRPLQSHAKTATTLRQRYEAFVTLYPEVFISDQDKTLRFTDDTLASCVEELSGLKLIDLGISTISLAFQVLRTEALKQKEGQYFTPQPVIEAGVRLMRVQFDDIILDPACGTGGFLVETILDVHRRMPSMSQRELAEWAQTHIYGIDKDAIGVKLTKAIMQIVGNGAAHCVRGDSIRKHNWQSDFVHLRRPHFSDGRFTVVVTNPPFGQNLKVSASDSRLSTLDLAKRGTERYTDLEIGLLFLQRSYQLLRTGGRLGIVLPETYFFSDAYRFVFDWLRPRLRPIVVANIPMDAFQGFCRAKTNFYVFEKIDEAL